MTLPVDVIPAKLERQYSDGILARGDQYREKGREIIPVLRNNKGVSNRIILMGFLPGGSV